MNDTAEQTEVKPEEVKPVVLDYDRPPKEWVPGTEVPKGKDGKEPDPYEMSDTEYIQYCYENRMPFWAIKRAVHLRFPPEVTSIEPSTAAVGDDSFNLTVSGEKFFVDSVIVFAGEDHATQMNEDGTLSTGIHMGVWYRGTVVPVYVRNGGNLSNVVEFTITDTAGSGAAGHAPDPDEAEEVDEPDDNGKPAKRKAKHKK